MSEMQEKPRFFDRCVFTPDLIRKSFKDTMPLSNKLFILALGIIVIAAGILRFTDFIGPADPPTAVCFLVAGAALLVYLLFFPAHLAKKQCKALEERGRLNVAQTAAFFEQNILFSAEAADAGKEIIGYDAITRVQHCDNLLYLWRQQAGYNTIEADKLEGGTVDELKAFLQEKNPNIRMR